MAREGLTHTPVLDIHLQEVYRALDSAYGLAAAIDLQKKFSNLGGANQPSNLTRALEKACARIEGYLNEQAEEETDDVS